MAHVTHALAPVTLLRPLARASVSYETGHPTTAQYGAFEKMCSHFCAQLFDARLPNPMLVFDRRLPSASFFAADAWSAKDDVAPLVSEIALNPEMLRSLSARCVAAALVHELTHLWQHALGAQKSRPGYHIMEWSLKMESVGLMPSETGEPGGPRVGQTMSQHVVPGGPFEKAFDSMPQDWLLPFLSAAGTALEKEKDPSKSKFVCPSCGDIARGKPSLEIDCRKSKCRTPFLLETAKEG